MFNYKKAKKMSLVKRFPIGLALACMVMLGSCSKEEMQVAEPETEISNEHSSSKMILFPWISPTKGYPIYNYLPNLWERFVPTSGPSDPIAFPTGISNPIFLWGNTASPFKQALPTIPNEPWSSFVTLTTSSRTDLKKKSIVETKIRFLKPGKTYSLTVYVATAIPKWKGLGPIPHYAERCELWVGGPSVGIKTFNVDLSNKQNVWIKKNIIFQAKVPEMTFAAHALPENEGEHAWAHIFIGQNPIVQID